jgi:hypothetical protein
MNQPMKVTVESASVTFVVPRPVGRRLATLVRCLGLCFAGPVGSRGAVWFFSVFAGVLLAGRMTAAEYSYTFTYNATNYTTKVWWDNATTNVQAVIIHFNYAAGAALYSNPNWQTFARARGFAMMLTINQDYPLSAGDGLKIISNTLASTATQSGRSELTNWQPYVFTGVSRGGTLGALNQGWAAGRNQTIACIAYHGGSLAGYYASSADAKAIPVLYLVASLDDPVQGRQGIIEDWVRLGANYGYAVRPDDGAFWTTSMQYGFAHNTTGNDTYVLQWLGRVLDARFSNTNRGTLGGIVPSQCHGINYTMASPNTTSCAFTNIAVLTNFVALNKMIWLPPGNDAEWLWENATPRINSLGNSPGSLYAGETNTVGVTASTPNSEPMSYLWTVASAPAGGTVVFGNPRAATTSVVPGPVPGTYSLQVVVSSADPGINNTGAVSVVVSPPPVLRGALAGANLILTGGNGLSGRNSYLLTSTNLALPLSNWTRLATNAFGLNGGFSFTNPISPVEVSEFFRVLLR